MVGRSIFAALLALPVLVAPEAAAGYSDEVRPFTAHDLVRMEGFGGARIERSGRWVVWERRGRYEAAASYAYATLTSDLLTDLIVVDAHGERPDLVVGEDDDAGYRAGPISPDGRRMMVHRLTTVGRSLGVLTFETGEIDWFDLSVDLAILGRTAAWRSDEEIIAILTPEGRQPHYYRLGWETQALTAAAWRSAQEGRDPTALQIWSGQRRDQRPQRRPGRLVALRPDDGRVRLLAEGEFFDLEIAAGGAAAAVLENAEEVQVSGGRLAIGDPTRRRRLKLVDLTRGGATEPLADRDLLSHLLSWSRDGQRLLVFSRRPGAAWSEGRFSVVSADGRARDLDLGEATPALLRISGEKIPIVRGGWPGDQPAVLVDDPELGRRWLDLNDGRRIEGDDYGAIRQDEDGAAWFDTAAGLAPWGGAPTRGLRFAHDGSARDGGSRAGWNPAGPAPQAVVDVQGCVTPHAGGDRFCPDGDGRRAAAAPGVAVIVEARDDGATEVRMVGPSGERLLDILNPSNSGVEWGGIREIAHSGVDGEPLKSWLLVPPGPAPAGGHPLVVLIYPGHVHPGAPALLKPGSERGQINALVLASAGYAVLVPSLPLASDGDGSLPDLSARIDRAVDAALQSGGLDPDRMGLMGHSFGGRGVLIAGTQTQRYRALVSSAGTADYAGGFRDTLHAQAVPSDGILINAVSGYYESGQGGLGILPWESPAAWTRASPFYAADRIHTPTLLIRGDLDPVGADAMFAALYRLGREASLVTYGGEGHVLSSPANIIDLHARVLAWLEAHLAPRGEPVPPAAEP